MALQLPWKKLTDFHVFLDTIELMFVFSIGIDFRDDKVVSLLILTNILYDFIGIIICIILPCLKLLQSAITLLYTTYVTIIS